MDRKVPGTYSQSSPMLTSYVTTVPWKNQEIGFGMTPKAYSDFISFICTCVCVYKDEFLLISLALSGIGFNLVFPTCLFVTSFSDSENDTFIIYNIFTDLLKLLYVYS